MTYPARKGREARLDVVAKPRRTGCVRCRVTACTRQLTQPVRRLFGKRKARFPAGSRPFWWGGRKNPGKTGNFRLTIARGVSTLSHQLWGFCRFLTRRPRGINGQREESSGQEGADEVTDP